MADLVGCGMMMTDEVAYQRHLQSFLDRLKPWLYPGDCPEPCPAFTVFSRIEIDDETETLSLIFTPEGLAFFRAWLRRQGIDPTVNLS
jgi:hypothetical protein